MMQTQSGTMMNSTQQYAKPLNVNVREGSTHERIMDALYYPYLNCDLAGKTDTEGDHTWSESQHSGIFSRI